MNGVCNETPFGPRHNITNKVAYALKKDSDQPGYPPSLIRVFAVRMELGYNLRYPLRAKQRLFSDWANAHAYLSLHQAHYATYVGFVLSQLMYG